MILPRRGREPDLDLGYVLVKEQLFFRKELIERVYWFIGLRWIAAGVTLLGTWVAYFLGLKLPLLPLNIIVFLIILYNTAFLVTWRRLNRVKPQDVKSFTLFAHIQIALDLLTLYVMIYFTGGIYSPLLIFVVFHIILAGILLPPVSPFLYGVFVLFVTACLVALRKSTFLPAQPVLFQSSISSHELDVPGIMVLFLILTVVLFVSAFLITSIMLSLRNKGRELLRISKDLDVSNARLTALYEMVEEMGLCADLQALMDSATRNAATIMGVKGCSIKLLDEQRQTLRFSSTYGLSEDYIGKGSIDIEKSPITRKIGHAGG